jgi:hypothetical protein
LFIKEILHVNADNLAAYHKLVRVEVKVLDRGIVFEVNQELTWRLSIFFDENLEFTVGFEH